MPYNGASLVSVRFLHPYQLWWTGSWKLPRCLLSDLPLPEQGAKDTAREVVSHGVRAEIVQLDLGNLPEGAQALEKLIQRLGRIDVLVNNAGAMTKAPFLDMAFDEWRKIFTVDVDGAFLCSQIAARQMVKQGQGGRIINMVVDEYVGRCLDVGSTPTGSIKT